MSEFNRMTIVAAAELISELNSHSDMEVLEVEWGIAGQCSASSKAARVAGWARIATGDNPEVITVNGRMSLSRAMVEKGIEAPGRIKTSASWKKLIAGLRFDGFDVEQDRDENTRAFPWDTGRADTSAKLVRMLPNDVPDIDFRQAEDETTRLLNRHNFNVAVGHLKQALSAFNRGEWSSANGELRNFFEGLINEIAERFGCESAVSSKSKRDFLGQLEPPFLNPEYNEWNVNNQKPQFIQGLTSRLHPHGGHPGLSEEEDASFRLQIILVTARLLLRRFDARCSP